MPAHIALVGGIKPPKNGGTFQIFTYFFNSGKAAWLLSNFWLILACNQRLINHNSLLQKCQRI
jgi:hypothetical protein